MKRCTWMIGLCMMALVSPVVESAEPIKALLITGGCCHDYEAQTKRLVDGISKHANVSFEIVHEGKGTKHIHSPFKKENWTKGYDVVIHNECSAALADEVGAKVAKEHHDSGVGVVAIHCAFHSFRNMEGDEWRKLLGAKSKRHTHQAPIDITFDDPGHPIVKGIKPFTSGKEELYVIDEIYDNAHVLALGTQGETVYPLMFVANYGKAKTFSTTIGHNVPIFDDSSFMEIVSRGLLWVCDKLDDSGKPKKGYAAKAAK